VAIEQLGGRTRINALPPRIHRGETAQVCYGVANAKTVTLERNPAQLALPQPLRGRKASKNNSLYLTAPARR